jgi:alpha-tubulin suppressor-like RCC1 family protein
MTKILIFFKYGQLGVSDKINKNSPVEIIQISGMIQIAAGGFHSIFLRNNGKIYVCGRNDFGQLGIGTTVDVDYPTELTSFFDAKMIAAGAFHSSIVTKTGDIYTTGRNQFGQLGIKKVSSFQNSFQILFTLGEVDEIVLGEDYSIAVKSGILYGFGNNVVNY